MRALSQYRSTLISLFVGVGVLVAAVWGFWPNTVGSQAPTTAADPRALHGSSPVSHNAAIAPGAAVPPTATGAAGDSTNARPSPSPPSTVGDAAAPGASTATDATATTNGAPGTAATPAAPSPDPASPAATAAAPASRGNTVTVNVAGLVKRPGVYTLPATARVIEAVNMAGGIYSNADIDSVNLAARLQDAEQIYIPPRQPAQAPAAMRTPAPAGRVPMAGPRALAQESMSFSHSRRVGGSSSAGGSRQSSRSQKLSDPSQGMVNINTAGPDELVRLPGVGPATAQKILDFRKTNGNFTSPQDIMNVKGIGPAKFAKMQPFITVR